MRRIIRKLHIYVGLVNLAALLVYGVAGLVGSARGSPEGRPRPQGQIRVEKISLPPNLTDHEAALYVCRTLGFAPEAPVPPNAVRRDQDNNVVFSFYSVNGVKRVVLREKEQQVQVEDMRNNFWNFLNNIHGATLRSRVPDLRVRAWIWYNEIAIWSLSWMAITGVYLWLASRPKYVAAHVSFAGGGLLFLILYFVTR